MPAHPPLTLVERETIRAGWHTMRDDYHRLVGSISPESLTSRTLNTHWSIAEMLTHMIQSIELIPQEIEAVRKGKNFLNVPPWVAGKANMLWIKLRALRATQQSLLDNYDIAFDVAMQAWDAVRDDEWSKGANFFGEAYRTLADNYAIAITHFHEHAEQIRKSLEG